MNKAKYEKNAERLIKKLFKRIDDWRTTAINYRELIDSRLYKLLELKRVAAYISALFCLCFILAAFDFGVIWRFQ